MPSAGHVDFVGERAFRKSFKKVAVLAVIQRATPLSDDDASYRLSEEGCVLGF